MMKRFRQVFQNRHAILPVIHVSDVSQVIDNIAVVTETQCDGAFLINHSVSIDDLLEMLEIAKQNFPTIWLGINCLGLEPVDALKRISTGVAGLWTDNAQIDERSESQPQAIEMCDAIAKKNWPGLYFGGVAFKYQREVHDLSRVVRAAISYVDVITTSGPGTGQAASVTKLESMRMYAGDTPIALASGITPRNVTDYLPHVDAFLVATGISRSFTELDRKLVEQLVSTVRNYSV